MSKYDQEYSSISGVIARKDANTSWSLLADKIRPRSRVLEVGPASGYMTRYLKEELGCDVCIAEIDPACAEKAGSYAVRSFVGDIEKVDWWQQWPGDRFDVILFADVLEHLKNPWRVLSISAGFLNPGGRILASVPNLAHTSILIELWQNRFAYRPVGLLDSGHLRFFSRNSINELFESAGLKITSVDFTRLAPEETEFKNSLKELPWIVRRAFRKRLFAEAYQFIVEAEPGTAGRRVEMV